MATDGSQPCPDCGNPVRPDQQQLCPNCGYPLLLLRTKPQSEARAVPRAPGERDDATALMTGTAPAPIVAEPPEPAGLGEVDCRRCGYRNEAVRIRCERCGEELRNARPAAVALPPPEAVVVGRPRRRAWVVAAAAVAVVALIAAFAFAVSRRSGAPPAGPGAPAPAALVRIDPAGIKASASSTIPQSRFRIQNTLDGDPQTVWNSDGERLKSNIGVTLTFRFAQTVNLARITVINGSARNGTNFVQNQRIAQLRIRTDAGEATWQLEDAVEPQSVSLKPAPTSVVIFVVEKVYQSTRWPDLALTEVSFDRTS